MRGLVFSDWKFPECFWEKSSSGKGGWGTQTLTCTYHQPCNNAPYVKHGLWPTQVDIKAGLFQTYYFIKPLRIVSSMHSTLKGFEPLMFYFHPKMSMSYWNKVSVKHSFEGQICIVCRPALTEVLGECHSVKFTRGDVWSHNKLTAKTWTTVNKKWQNFVEGLISKIGSFITKFVNCITID